MCENRLCLFTVLGSQSIQLFFSSTSKGQSQSLLLLLAVGGGFMATHELLRPSIQSYYLIPSKPKFINQIRNHKASSFSAAYLRLRSSRGLSTPVKAKATATVEGTSGFDGKTTEDIKLSINEAIQGINRGIFGAPSTKKSEIEGLVMLLESQNPTPDPTKNLDKVDGCWKLVYSTISILGSKRTKLGLRDFISLGDFFQNIDVAKGKAVNVVEFNARGLALLKGQLTIEASFKIASESRVDIKYENSTITPDQLMTVFQKNYDLLLSIFNPEGWLEISYVDETTRIGRDDKGNIFILEKSEP